MVIMSISAENTRKMTRFELAKALVCHRTDFSGNDFTGIDLSSLDLSNRVFRNCTGFNGANFFNTDLDGADFSGADLSGAKGLCYAKNLDKAIFNNTVIDEKNRQMLERKIAESSGMVTFLTSLGFPQFEATPYGGKLQLDKNTVLLVLSPNTDTAAGKSKEELIDGMRPHPNTRWEQVTFLRYADNLGQNDDNAKPLLYEYKDPRGDTKREWYGPGENFYSVKASGKIGNLHVIKNTSDRPMLLLIKAEMMPVEIRSGSDRTTGA
ncbi:MAG: pentapeptide repeat-containing protein [Candidatus Micrarchaeota archaeon]|nr:pentapeptide repeat-containing protein [Candidatus Micrarchaeota archaeon]